VDRLQYVAEVCPPLQQEAKTLGVAYARSVGNTTALKAFKGKNMTAMDWEWVDAANTEAASKLSALDRELSHHKASMSKEGIRQSYMAMGDHLALRGELQEALKCYVRMRDYCSTAQHSVQMCIKVGICLNGLRTVVCG
jgi:COP9 signalosome complex subunit 1